MSRLEIKRLDSPLARSTRAPRPIPPKTSSHTRSSRKHRHDPSGGPRQNAASPGWPACRRRRPTPTAASSDPLEGLPDPPASERVARASLHPAPDLAASIALRAHRRACGHDDGERVSQKSLPEQEVLAVLIWLAGSAQDPQAVARLGAALDAYRARRYAAAAEALRPSAPAGESP